MDYPPISCYCSTYGRPKHIIENSIYWFLQQDYPGKKELVILNDLGDQILIFDHPEVNIINIENQIIPLGKKFNTNIKHCKYDLLATWEDDDIFLPHRLRLSYEKMKSGIFHTQSGLIEESVGKLTYSGNYFHSTHLFTRELFEEVGGYDESDLCSLDVSIMTKFTSKVGDYSQTLDNNDVFYIYCWVETNSYHGSWREENISNLAKDHVAHDLQSGKLEKGEIILNPKPRYNFLEFLPPI